MSPAPPPSPAAAGALVPPPLSVEARGLVVRYGELCAVDSLDLTVPRGALFALLGPNGAGKSTTIQVLTTLRAPTSGHAAVAGYDVSRDAREVRRRMGVVFQEISLDDRLTARENLLLSAAIFGVPRDGRRRRIEEHLAWVGLSASADQVVRTFSGGMKRRLEIARAMVHDPEVLILDEPTVGLDPQTRRAVWEHLAQLASRDRTIFVTTHYMDEAERCDDVAILDHGKLVARGTPEALVAHAGGERLLLRTEDDARAGVAARALGLTAREAEHGLEIEGDRAEVMLARLAERGLGLREVTVVRPSLEDAFVALTGHDLRDDKDGQRGEVAAMRTRIKARRGGA